MTNVYVATSFNDSQKRVFYADSRKELFSVIFESKGFTKDQINFVEMIQFAGSRDNLVSVLKNVQKLFDVLTEHECFDKIQGDFSDPDFINNVIDDIDDIVKLH